MPTTSDLPVSIPNGILSWLERIVGRSIWLGWFVSIPNGILSWLEHVGEEALEELIGVSIPNGILSWLEQVAPFLRQFLAPFQSLMGF